MGGERTPDGDHAVKLPIDPASVKGFLDPDEGSALYRWAHDAVAWGPCLEVGSYCGKSALYLGAACKSRGGLLFTVDHHRGSEEMQPGWEHHDAETPTHPASLPGAAGRPALPRDARTAGSRGTVAGNAKRPPPGGTGGGRSAPVAGGGCGDVPGRRRARATRRVAGVAPLNRPRRWARRPWR